MQEKKLTDEEIVKAFENCCINGVGCAECPYATWYRGNTGGCAGDVEEDILDLINRLQSKNEQQKKYIEYLKRKLDEANVTYRSNL